VLRDVDLTSEFPGCTMSWRAHQEEVWLAALADIGDDYGHEKLEDHFEVHLYPILALARAMGLVG
jgi:hypothetical protein